MNPNVTSVVQNAAQKAYEAWIERKWAHDQSVALQDAASKNGEVGGDVAPAPGPEPKGLLKLAGPAPCFVVSVRPVVQSVQLDETEFSYEDQVELKPRYAYFRFSAGVRVSGQPLKELDSGELASLLSDAGLSESEARVMKAVSKLEGGFDSVNTYDTGYVSVGFIQFACLEKGKGSLGKLLSEEKRVYPEAFARDFHKFGVDVASDASMVVVDPETGEELGGAMAALKVIEDKRLVAVFQHAGQASREFKLSQLRTAKALYYPGDDTVAVRLPSGAARVAVSQIVKSEAGMAVLMDRKVNTGSLAPFGSLLSQLASAGYGVEEMSAKEGKLVKAMVFRRNYLNDLSLSQPAACADQRIAKKAMRRKRTKG